MVISPDQLAGSARARIVSIQVGLPCEMDVSADDGPRHQPWRSGIVKRAVAGPVRLSRLNIDGDGQADLIHHGGADKAVLAYSADHYPLWQEEFADAETDSGDVGYGGFGENLTVRGANERNVCIGDVWRASAVLLQVSQPRQPCWKLARRWRMPNLPQRVVETGRSGWYLRVLQEGMIEPDTELALETRPHPQWTVDRVASVRYDKQADRAAVAELARLAELSESWREDFARRL